MNYCARCCAGALLLFLAVGALRGEPPPPEEPKIAPASDEAEQAIMGFRRPEGWQVGLFAAEPDVANPVAFCFDRRGRVYVCESFRQSKGIEDNRGHGDWLDEDLAARTVADRLAYIKRHLGERAVEYTRQDDRIRLLVDSDGDHRADTSTVFADRFNDIVDGTGAGVLASGGDVYYTCIPNLWLLKDTDGDSRSDVRRSLNYGFGVRFAFRGHDMHGLIVGPDGRLYFSIGDRGYNVTTADGRKLVNPESGAVFRCNLDGSQLEVFATGLRNPQELAFDDFGNLFTGDNNSDSGDRARCVYVVRGGDSGWRMAYQYLRDRGPFNREKIWHPQHPGQPAYIVPPVANFADGPSGLAYYPGTGLSDHYRGRFFLCDFRGGPGNSGVRTFRVRPSGAFFELVDDEQTIWNILATDVVFGPDGGVYVSDWVNGWNGEGKGRIYRFYDPRQQASPEARGVARLLREGFSQRKPEELKRLLSHADRRIRQGAQFALVEQAHAGSDARDALKQTAAAADNQLARLHGIWGLWQLKSSGPLLPLLDDEDAEVRAQAAKVLGELRTEAALDKLIARLTDESLRVRYFAAQALGQLGRRAAVGPLLDMLAENADRDVVLRHGGVMGLAGCGDRETLVAAAGRPSAAARMGVLLAMRRKQLPEVARFLSDVDPLLVVEAARAIHDVPIPEALPDLASLIARNTDDDALLRRVLNANYRLGKPENAAALAQFAANSHASEAMRLEALEMLAAWEKPSSRDRVLNMWRPIEPRSAAPAAEAVRTWLPGILASGSKVQSAGAKVAALYGIKDAVPVLREVLADTSRPAATRGDALEALARLEADGLEAAIDGALQSESPLLRAAARRAFAERYPRKAIEKLEQAVYEGELIERQSALATLTTLLPPGAEAALYRVTERLLAGEIPADTRLDVVEAARGRGTARLKQQLARYAATAPADDSLSTYRDALLGGSPERGRSIFFERTAVSCVRCHKIAGAGGEVGPDLSKIGSDKERRYLLEAVVDPNRAIAKGFESVLVADDEGRIVSGIVRHEDDRVLRLMTSEGRLVDVPKDTIEARRAGKSAMPEDLVKQLSLFDVRDLVAFLSALKDGKAE